MVVKIWAGLAAVAVELSLLGWMVAGRGVDWFLAFCNDHRHFAGLVVPLRRRVRPQGPGGRSLPHPILVALDIDQIEVET